jgi:uncharacterized protein YtpQ (UPF0354 family)
MVRKMNKGWEVHHMPADSISPLSRWKWPTIYMSKADHKLTGSYKKSASSIKYRNKQKKLIEDWRFREAIQMDIDDIRSKFWDKYDEWIKQMLKYYNNNSIKLWIK